MNSLTTVKELLFKLTKGELKLLVKSVSIENTKVLSRSKSTTFINLFLSNPELTSYEFQKRLYGNLNYGAFNKLISRLKLKIYEIVMHEQSISSKFYSKRNCMNFELRKRLLQADIYQLKGSRKGILPLYNYIISKSGKFELYELKIQALISKQRLLNANKGSLFLKIKSEIIRSEQCNLDLKNSNIIYNDITNIINISKDFEEYKHDLIKSINLLNKYYLSSSSPTIGYYYYILSADLSENIFEINEAIKHLESAKKLLIINESAYTDNRFGNVLLNLANSYLLLFDLDRAIIHAQESKKYFKKLIYTQKIVDELLFFTYFYKADYSQCFKILSNNLSPNENEFIFSKFVYYKSVIYFIQNNFNMALRTILEYKEIERDKEGLNIYSRVFLIIIYIEINEYEIAELHIQNLIRFSKRISKIKEKYYRQNIIIKILTKLLNENFDFKKVRKSRQKYFEELNLQHGICSWKIKSPELIVFNKWFDSKIIS